jgi:AraC-like DNA-binding protein
VVVRLEPRPRIIASIRSWRSCAPRRDAAAIQLRQVDLEIGITIGKLLDSGGPYTLSSISRDLGVSHTHVKTLAQRSGREPQQGTR